jgi:hypothetical protein
MAIMMNTGLRIENNVGNVIERFSLVGVSKV